MHFVANQELTKFFFIPILFDNFTSVSQNLTYKLKLNLPKTLMTQPLYEKNDIHKFNVPSKEVYECVSLLDIMYLLALEYWELTTIIYTYNGEPYH